MDIWNQILIHSISIKYSQRLTSDQNTHIHQHHFKAYWTTNYMVSKTLTSIDNSTSMCQSLEVYYLARRTGLSENLSLTSKAPTPRRLELNTCILLTDSNAIGLETSSNWDNMIRLIQLLRHLSLIDFSGLMSSRISCKTSSTLWRDLDLRDVSHSYQEWRLVLIPSFLLEEKRLSLVCPIEVDWTCSPMLSESQWR